MKFIIIGANGENGSDVNLTIEAQNADEARLQANALGILVSSIIQADVLNPVNAMTSLHPTQIPPPETPRNAPTATPPATKPAAANPSPSQPKVTPTPQKLASVSTSPSTAQRPATSTNPAKPSFLRTYRVPLIIGGVLVGGLAFIVLVTVVIVGILLMKPNPKHTYSSFSSGSGSSSSSDFDSGSSSNSGSSYSPPPSPPPVSVESSTARTKRRTIECWNATIAINNSLSRLATDNQTEYWGQMIERYSALDTTDVAPEVQTFVQDWINLSRRYYNAMSYYNRKNAAIRAEVKTARDTAYRMSKPENAELAANIAELATLALYEEDQKKLDANFRAQINTLNADYTANRNTIPSVQKTLTAKYGIQF